MAIRAALSPAQPWKFVDWNRRFGLAGPPVPSCTTCGPMQAPLKEGALPPASQSTTALSGPLSAFAALVSERPGCGLNKPDSHFDKALALGHFGENARFLGLLKLSNFIAAIAGTDLLSSAIPALEEITNFSHEAFAAVVKGLRDPVKELATQLKNNAGDVIFPNFSATLSELSWCARRCRRS